MKKIFVGLILIATILTMTGCLNYTEETWLNDNGSGKLRMEIGISEAITNMSTQQQGEDPFAMDKIKKGFKGNKDVKLISSKTYNKDGNKVIQMEIEFKSLKALEAWMNSGNQSGDPGFIGKASMTKNKKGQIIYSRVLAFKTQSTADQGSSNEEFAAMGEQMMASLFSNYIWHYTIHFPYKVISANTADEYIDRKSNTVKWDYSLISLTKKPQTMKAVLRPYNFFESILHKLHLYN